MFRRIRTFNLVLKFKEEFAFERRDFDINQRNVQTWGIRGDNRVGESLLTLAKRNAIKINDF